MPMWPESTVTDLGKQFANQKEVTQSYFMEENEEGDDNDNGDDMVEVFRRVLQYTYFLPF